ncbi:MAG TPA: AAA family ATPase, partial [Pyrinomonadaceae bacterium]|nr:AAA family ATPase [Pyrinomonadaceae bacterium]
ASAWPAINLCGYDRDGMSAVAARVGASLRMQLHSIRASDIPASVAERDALSRLWEREAVLMNSALLIDYDEPEHARAVSAFIDNVQGMIFVASREPLRQSKRQAVRFDVNKPAAAEQRELWRSALDQVAPQLNGHLETLTAQFSFGAEGIRAASTQVLQCLSSESDEEAPGKDGTQESLDMMLWDACRMRARSRLDDLAQRIEPAASWDDLVLPEAQLQTLRAVAAQVRARARVYEKWGFAAKGGRGLGISALFAGASGTGKTMAAEVIARELRLDLYRIDLSQVVNKYIGETEKNLRRVFDAAEEGGAVLLFDEADALFGKRSEVKDSHDRYANIEISYLLQRMEEYRGLAILTTNLKSVLDTAFLRRLRFVVQFPFPDHTQRAAIWQRIFPVETPTENLDVTKLARLNVAGGNIRNIALNAAFLAAHDKESVRMSHLLRAARGEYAKLEKTLADSEVTGWV